MARTRAFDTDQVLRISADLFCRRGFEGTSIDTLVTATGVQRGSLYGAFGSKLGLFVSVLDSDPIERPAEVRLDLLLVALLELAHRDDRVSRICAAQLAPCPEPGRTLGDRLLSRAGLEPPVHQSISPDRSRSGAGEPS